MNLHTHDLVRPARFVAQPLADTRPARMMDEHTRLLEEAMSAARAEGLRQARDEVDAAVAGHDAARKALLQAAAALGAAVAALQSRDRDDLGELEQQAIAFGVELAEHLVGRELETVDAQLLAAIGRATALAPERGPIVLRVHPQDVELAREGASENADLAGRVEVRADGNVQRGGCVAVAGPMRIDAQLGPAMDRVRAALGE